MDISVLEFYGYIRKNVKYWLCENYSKFMKIFEKTPKYIYIYIRMHMLKLFCKCN